ncbi:MAG: RdgB/HAM1 family non-canonical purine NTP pyrophosphatase [Thermomicrobiales bacterium]
MTSAMPTVLVATSNAGKLAEFARLLPSGIQIVSLAEAGVALPEETGETFAENARLKALAGAVQSGLLTIADDSGLAADALGGAPGIRSARFAGEPSSDSRNRAALLAAMADVPEADRTARFICSVAIASPNGIEAEASGVCEGRVGFAERGAYGFGYDPLFVLPDGRTMAELTPGQKDAASHRGKAYQAILPHLRRLLGATA